MFKENCSRYLVYVAAIAGHRIDAFESLYLNDDAVTVPVSGAQLVGTVSAMTDGRYSGGIVTIDSRVGLSTETYYSLVNGYASTAWGSTFRGDSIASIAMVCAPVEANVFNQRYPYSDPKPRPVLRWARVYDWRDSSQSLSDSSTWKWSQNAAVCIANWICHSSFGFHEDFAGSILPAIEDWTQAANDCDELKALKAGGTEPAYRINGFSTTETSNASTLMTMLQCCDGYLVKIGDVYRLSVGKYHTPTVIITDDDISAVTFQNGIASEDLINYASAKWTSPDNGFVSVDTDPVLNTDEFSTRPGAPRKTQLDLGWVQSPGQASRLLRREMIRHKNPLRGKLTLFWSGMNAAFERRFIVQSNSIPRLSNVVVENMKPVISARAMRVEIEFVGTGPEIDDYNPSTDETAHPNVAARPSAASAAVPTGLAVVGELVTDGDGNGSVVAVLSWDDPAVADPKNTAYTFIGQYRFHDVGGGTPGAWVSLGSLSATLSAGVYSAQTGVMPNANLDFAIASIGGGTSAYCTPVTASMEQPNVAPQAPTWVSAVGAVGHATLTVTAPNSSNFYAVQFYRAVSGGSFAGASAIGSPVTSARNATISYTDTHGAGTFDYFATSITSASVGSSPAGPRSATIT
jgi:hypothetical protein